jgi:hypothetical protein
MHPVWLERALEFMSAMDTIDLVGLQTTLADLGLADCLERVLRRKLEEILGPPVKPELPKKKPAAKKITKPPNVSESAWRDYRALRKGLKRKTTQEGQRCAV